MDNKTKKDIDEDWWQTDIIRMRPGEIEYHGYAIEDLIGRVSFVEMIWLMLKGELPDKAQAKLLDTVLMSSIDHGPQAPSIAIARMAMTCGVDLNNAMASAVNVLGDIHGGAGEQAVDLYYQIDRECTNGSVSYEQAVAKFVDPMLSQGHLVPGFGHRFHPVDPRAPQLLQQVKDAADKGVVAGRFAAIAVEIEQFIASRKGKKIPLNIDGASAVIYAELGFPAPLARGLFCLSRSVGILAHAWEQQQQGGRNKGPLPKSKTWTYTGKVKRSL